jgi:archaetidylinositol phosphate synthase
MTLKESLVDVNRHSVPRLAARVQPIATVEPAPVFRSARRHLNGLSSGLERSALIWLAQRTPARINSDHLTLLGFVAMFFVGASYALAHWNRWGLLLATFFLVLNWLGDSLDGTLARVRKHERPRYGFYVDHLLDVFGALFLSSSLAVSGFVDWRIAFGVLVAFLMLSIEIYLATYTLGVFRLSFGGFGGTELRLVLAAGNVALWLNPLVRVLHSYRLFDFGGFLAIVAMAVMLVVTVPQHILQLYREERLP